MTFAPFRAAAMLTALCLLLCCCAAPAQSAAAAAPSKPNPSAAVSEAAEAPPPPPPGQKAVLRESEAAYELSDPLLEAIYRYFDAYYDSLSTLEPADITGLFSPIDAEGCENVLLNQYELETVCAVRSIRENDLTLSDYEYGLTVTSVEGLENGLTAVTLLEDSRVKFSFLDGVESSASGTGHHFWMTGDDESGWSIAWHGRGQDIFLRLSELYSDSRGDDPIPHDTAVELLEDILSRIVEQAGLDEQDRLAQREAYLADPDAFAPQKEWQYDYDRGAAVSYSYEWVDPVEVVRSDEWFAYDDYGGNCQNYVSQCLYAGGIPMDYISTLQWKWYGEHISTANRPSGRSPAWAGDEEFYEYCCYNRYGGPVAETDANLFTAQPGDVLQYALLGNWYHSVLVTEVVYDDEGYPVDVLVNSNTTDHVDFPASAYGYSTMRLIRILGHNGEERVFGKEKGRFCGLLQK